MTNGGLAVAAWPSRSTYHAGEAAGCAGNSDHGFQEIKGT